MATPYTRRTLLTAGLLSAGLAVGLPGASGANAATGCRSDPIVVLSNGVVLDLGANIADDVSDVQSISYTLHAPKGIALLRAVSTDGQVGYREKFTFKSDSKFSGTGGVYEVDVQVRTHTKNISVTATIAGADAAVLGITANMVIPGAGSFRPVDANDARTTDPTRVKGHGSKGRITLTALPATVTDALNAWAQSAPWTVTASATNTVDQNLVITVTL